MPTTNVQKSVIAQCQVVIFKWLYEDATEDLSFEDLAKSTPFDVSLELQQVAFEKNMTGPTGSFSFSLPNTRDWKAIIKPGTWCLIYMTNEGDLALPEQGSHADLADVNVDALVQQKKKLRGICYIDRVARKAVVDDKGLTDISFDVSGRDFGVVYEEATIWHNFFQFEQSIIDTAAVQLRAGNETATVDQLLKTIHALFYSPSEFSSMVARDPRSPNSLSQVGFQWLLPLEMLRALGLKIRDGLSNSFYGHIDGLLNFSPSKATYPVENPLSSLNGNAWMKLKAHSVEQFHELFVETDEDGNPKLTFRPIPWKVDSTGYPLIGDSIQAYSDLAASAVQVEPIDIEGYDLGEDGHNRYNHFYTGISTGDFSANNNIADLEQPSPADRKFPLAKIGSIARYGFRPMHAEIDALINFGQNKDGTPNTNLLVQYNEVIYDYWNSAIFLESGSVNLVGRNDVKIGKALVFSQDCPQNKNMIFYIEGYVDTFSIDGNQVPSWSQQVKLSRGAEIDTVKNFKDRLAEIGQNPFSKKVENYDGAGEFTKGDKR